MTVFDRSWYGRVLVERVEGFATNEEWSRAYAEIVDFERSLRTEGTIMVKFWLHMSAEEQLRRFKERERTRSRAGSSRRTIGATGRSGRSTPRRWRTCWRARTMGRRRWQLVEGESKRFARVKVRGDGYR